MFKLLAKLFRVNCRRHIISNDAFDLLFNFPLRECINYSRIGGKTKETQALVKELREAGLIEHHIGLMDEDGNVLGSGWCLSEKGDAHLKAYRRRSLRRL